MELRATDRQLSDDEFGNVPLPAGLPGPWPQCAADVAADRCGAQTGPRPSGLGNGQYVLELERVERPTPESLERSIVSITTAPSGFEGEGFPVREILMLGLEEVLQ